ncbi:MAG: glycosyl hydrolase family 28-related protein [Verrucomicrobia bacterium]|nr:glycosyl hydrolase family 28-related protein [Verrucomicrobiota bacterium]
MKHSRFIGLLIGGGLGMLAVSPASALDVSVTAYGATANDGANDANAFSTALTAIVAGGGGTLYVPAGTFNFTSRKTVDLKNTGVAIAGAGKGVTQLSCENSTGLWWFNNSGSSNELILRDLTFVASNNGGSAGTAVQINNPTNTPYISNSDVCSLNVEHVDFQVTTAGADRFAHFLYASYLQLPRFVDVFVNGWGYSPPPEDGFRVNFGNGAYFENCYSKNVGLAFTLNNYHGDVTFSRCLAVGVTNGFQVVANQGESCTVNILDCHSNPAFDDVSLGVKIRFAGGVAIRNHASYCGGAVTNVYNDFYLDSCTNVVITGSVFHQPYCANRTLIRLTGNSRNALIQHNIFNARGTNVFDATVSGVTTNQNDTPPGFIL